MYRYANQQAMPPTTTATMVLIRRLRSSDRCSMSVMWEPSERFRFFNSSPRSDTPEPSRHQEVPSARESASAAPSLSTP